MDPWKTLGVAEDADLGTIKRAFRRLLWKCHPDLHPKRPGALHRFLEITEAYGRLTRLLNVQVRIVGNDELEEEISSLFFHKKDESGYSFFYLEVPYEKAFWGRRISVLLQGKEATCRECKGVGYVWDKGRPMCQECGGKGYRIVRWGRDSIRLLCKACGATGYSSQARCKACGGKGVTRVQREVYFPLPRGIRPGTLLEICCDPSLGIGPTFVEIGVELPKNWRFDGLDIVSELEISVWDALLGKIMKTKTIDGDVEIEIPQGAHHGLEIHLPKRGWIDTEGRRGDHRITLKVKMPESPAPKEAISRLQEMRRIWPVEEDKRGKKP